MGGHMGRTRSNGREGQSNAAVFGPFVGCHDVFDHFAQLETSWRGPYRFDARNARGGGELNGALPVLPEQDLGGWVGLSHSDLHRWKQLAKVGIGTDGREVRVDGERAGIDAEVEAAAHIHGRIFYETCTRTKSGPVPEQVGVQLGRLWGDHTVEGDEGRIQVSAIVFCTRKSSGHRDAHRISGPRL